MRDKFEAEFDLKRLVTGRIQIGEGEEAMRLNKKEVHAMRYEKEGEMEKRRKIWIEKKNSSEID